GDDGLLSGPAGRRARLGAGARADRFKAGRDVRDFAVVAPDRLLIDEGGDAPCLLTGDGRRLASARLPCEITALDVDADGTIRCGGADGGVRELPPLAGDEGDALALAPPPPPSP